MSNLKEVLKAYNAKLPPGIVAHYVRGKIHYRVTITSRSAMGQIRRHGLGTFLTLNEAVAAMVEFKVKGYIEGIPATQDVLATLAEAERIDTLAEQERFLATRTDAIEMIGQATENVIPGGTAGAFTILNNMPFHEVPTSGDCVTSLEDGTPITIPAKIVAEWFSSLEA